VEFPLFLYLAFQVFLCISDPDFPLMLPIHISLLLHIVGIGLLFTSLVGGWILHSHYIKGAGWGTRLVLLKAIRTFGLLSPVATALLVVSGAANMLLLQMGAFTNAWLSAKLVLVLLSIVNGIIFGIRGSKRSRLAVDIAESRAPEGAEQILDQMNRQQRLFFINQTILILVILGLSLVRP
jgi:hypothetical protein